MDISALMLHRYNAGYKLDQIKINEALSSKFIGFQNQFSHRSSTSQHMQGVKVFWQYMNKLQNVERSIDGTLLKFEFEIMNNGMLAYLINDEQQDSVQDVIGVKVYQSKVRQQIIEFCGWATNREKGKPANRKNKKIEEICNLINKSEAHIRGGDMRACVMAALHFEFQTAGSLIAMADGKQ